MRDELEPTQPQAPLRLGVILFLVSVGVMFIAVLVAYGVTRTSQHEWASAGIPRGLYLSTGLIAALSFTMRSAKRHVENNRLLSAQRSVRFATLLAVAFVAMQALNWLTVHRIEAVSHTLYAATFYMLTGLHALHVLGGLVPLVVVTIRLDREEYSSSRAEPVRLLSLYWDFLGVVWLVLLAALFLGS